MNKTISNKFAYLYFVLTAGIVMYHARSIAGYSINYLGNFDYKILSLYLDYVNHLGIVCMVFFFFASSFWFYRDISNNKELLQKYKKRIKTLLIPFLAWTIVIGIYQVITHQITINVNNLFYHLFLTPIAGPLWYILGILILQLFAPLIILIKKNKLSTTIIFIAISGYIFLRINGVIPHLLSFDNWWWYNNLIYYIPVYLLGTYIGMYHQELLLCNEYNEKKYTYIGVGLLASCIILWSCFFSDKIDLSIIYSLIELLGIWFILKPRWCTKKINKFFCSNFYIFALHNPILIPITRLVIVRYLPNILSLSGITTIIIKIIQVVIVVVVSSFARFCVIKIIPKLDKYLAGGR